ncbi:MAG: hypothetical protein LUQ24_01010 [Methanobacterium sp.]|nr:hypothetical protein [Methanobacterium sp.]
MNLFKATSMTISLLGIIMVLVTIGIGGYLLFQALSSTISTDVGSGTSYDKIAALKADYNSLNSQYAETKISIEKMNNKNATTSYDLAELELISAQTDIADAESAITAKKSSDEINSRIEQAQKQLVVANQALKDLQAEYL